MDCNEFRQKWTEWQMADLDAAAGRAMTAHRAGCVSCQRYDQQMGTMVEALGELPLPGTAPGEREQPQAAPARFGRPAVQAFALAATLVVGVAIGLLLPQSGLLNGGPGDADAVRLARTGVHEVQLAFESPGEISRVAFVVELPPGVEMVGYPDQRTVRWEGRLAAGRSRLRLPLRVTAAEVDGTLVARIVRGGNEQTLRVPLKVAAGGQAATHGVRTG